MNFRLQVKTIHKIFASFTIHIYKMSYLIQRISFIAALNTVEWVTSFVSMHQ
jgi:hypothetical protein